MSTERELRATEQFLNHSGLTYTDFMVHCLRLRSHVDSHCYIKRAKSQQILCFKRTVLKHIFPFVWVSAYVLNHATHLAYGTNLNNQDNRCSCCSLNNLLASTTLHIYASGATRNKCFGYFPEGRESYHIRSTPQIRFITFNDPSLHAYTFPIIRLIKNHIPSQRFLYLLCGVDATYARHISYWGMTQDFTTRYLWNTLHHPINKFEPHSITVNLLTHTAWNPMDLKFLEERLIGFSFQKFPYLFINERQGSAVQLDDTRITTLVSHIEPWIQYLIDYSFLHPDFYNPHFFYRS